MNTNLERVAAKARKETNLKFSSLAHHISKELIWESLAWMSKYTVPYIDQELVERVQYEFDLWIEELIESIHLKSYKPPAVRRVWMSNQCKPEKQSIGVNTIVDRALQRSTAEVLSAIYEQDFLNCSFGGRPGRGIHNALATLNEIRAGEKVCWVLEVELKNFSKSVDDQWMLEFVQHRVRDPRIISMINRWLKVGVMKTGEIQASKVGTIQGGWINVLLSNIYLHYVLDLWFEKTVKPRLKGEASLIRYIDDFIVCFQYYSDAKRFHETLKKRLQKFALTLEPKKTRLVEFGHFATKPAKERGKKVRDDIFFSVSPSIAVAIKKDMSTELVSSCQL